MCNIVIELTKKFKIAIMRKFNKVKEDSGNSMNSGIKLMNRKVLYQRDWNDKIKWNSGAKEFNKGDQECISDKADQVEERINDLEDR